MYKSAHAENWDFGLKDMFEEPPGELPTGVYDYIYIYMQTRTRAQIYIY